MAMDAIHIETMIREALPDAVVDITDTRGDGEHYAAVVTSAAFNGLPRVRQHQLVYDALQGKMGEALHALSLRTVPKT
ncbi:MAG: BolA family transcriptional regulator [Rhodospirillales bacterium]|nr:BolA family transcriptional regulator [Rhodospirillales bacterium]